MRDLFRRRFPPSWCHFLRNQQRSTECPGDLHVCVCFSILGLSVGVDIFTLICISIERYLAICRPLLILKLQSLPSTNLLNSCILIFIWLSALLIALPNFYFYQLCRLPKVDRFKCEKAPPSELFQSIYMIILDCMRRLYHVHLIRFSL